jgi:uncharacterized protein DUF6745
LAIRYRAAAVVPQPIPAAAPRQSRHFGVAAMSSSSSIRQKWLARMFSTEPADRARAVSAAAAIYRGARFVEPRHYCWFESPFRASWAIAVLLEARHPIWRELVAAARKTRGGRERVEEAEAALCRATGTTTIAAARDEIGVARGMTLDYLPQRETLIQPALLEARMKLYVGNVAAMFGTSSDDDPVARAEQRLWGGASAILISGLISHPTGTIIGKSFFADYPMARMAADEATALVEPPPLIAAAWDISAAAGLWWTFSGAAIFTERPEALHTDEKGFLHHPEAAAAVYRDGTRVYAWHGMAVPEEWILHPETIPPAKLRGLDPTLRKHVESKRGAAPRPRKIRASALLSTVLPIDPAARLEMLKAHAGGPLPLFERYLAGEHKAVWTELLARGADVRADPYAADALAVAYETMRRVRENVATIVAKLAAIDYQFTTPEGRVRSRATAHVLPDARTAKRVHQLEKEAGALPFSVRAFCEVVGAVDLIGRHRTLAPARGSVAPDPLVVAGVDELLSESEADEDDDVLALAPDDLHKANVSGGDPYAIAVPDPRADGVLLNERHEMLFVDYLRLCCRFGGFPGYEEQANPPVEIEELRRDLLDF